MATVLAGGGGGGGGAEPLALLSLADLLNHLRPCPPTFPGICTGHSVQALL